MTGMDDNVTRLDDHRPHDVSYVTCMECAHDWVAVQLTAASGPLECSSCGAMAGERVQSGDPEWFIRYMSGLDPAKRTMVLLNEKRMRDV